VVCGPSHQDDLGRPMTVLLPHKTMQIYDCVGKVGKPALILCP